MWKLLSFALLFAEMEGELISSLDEHGISCLPHTCSQIELQAPARAHLLTALKRELDILRLFHTSTRASETTTSKVATGTAGDKGATGGTAVLITVGGPARAESIVQAHVLMDTLRNFHLDTIPIEVG
jgi:hypothetical protein